MGSPGKRFEGVVPVARVLLPSGHFTMNTLVPLPGVTPPRWRMRDWGELQITEHDGVMCYSTHIVLVQSDDSAR